MMRCKQKRDGAMSTVHSLKLNTIVLIEATGLPSRVAGLNFQRRAAAIAASRSSDGPDKTRAAITSPRSLMLSSTVTVPAWRATRAFVG